MKIGVCVKQVPAKDAPLAILESGTWIRESDIGFETNEPDGFALDEALPRIIDLPDDERQSAEEAYGYMMLRPGAPLVGTAVDVCFIGSCTNGRLVDMQQAASVLRGRRIDPRVRLEVVPASRRQFELAMADGTLGVLSAAYQSILEHPSTPTGIQPDIPRYAATMAAMAALVAGTVLLARRHRRARHRVSL